MKKLIMVQHADGTREYICPKCSTPTKFTDSGHMQMCGGDVVETGSQQEVCPVCGTPYNYPKMKVSDFKLPDPMPF